MDTLTIWGYSSASADKTRLAASAFAKQLHQGTRERETVRGDVSTYCSLEGSFAWHWYKCIAVMIPALKEEDGFWGDKAMCVLENSSSQKTNGENKDKAVITIGSMQA